MRQRRVIFVKPEIVDQANQLALLLDPIGGDQTFTSAYVSKDNLKEIAYYACGASFKDEDLERIRNSKTILNWISKELMIILDTDKSEDLNLILDSLRLEPYGAHLDVE